MKWANLIPMVILCAQTSVGQTVRYPLSLPHMASGVYSNRFSTVLSARSNIASLAGLTHFGIGTYGERRFMLQEISSYSVAAALSTSSGNFAVMGDYFGYHGYNESELSIGYARKINDVIDIGAAFNYFSIRIPSYGKSGSYNFDLAAIIHINEELHTGVRVYNPLRSQLGKHGQERLAASYTAGIGYQPSGSFLSSLEIIKEDDRPFAIHAGIQYRPMSQLFSSAGYTTGSQQFYFGVGYLHKQIRLDIVANFHQYVGFSPGMMILYVPDKKTK